MESTVVRTALGGLLERVRGAASRRSGLDVSLCWKGEGGDSHNTCREPNSFQLDQEISERVAAYPPGGEVGRMQDDALVCQQCLRDW